jgi:hypothetical protein
VDHSDYIPKIRETEKIMVFLEDLKKNLNENQKQAITNKIEIIIDYFNERDKSREDL